MYKELYSVLFAFYMIYAYMYETCFYTIGVIVFWYELTNHLFFLPYDYENILHFIIGCSGSALMIYAPYSIELHNAARIIMINGLSNLSYNLYWIYPNSIICGFIFFASFFYFRIYMYSSQLLYFILNTDMHIYTDFYLLTGLIISLLLMMLNFYWFYRIILRAKKLLK